MFLMYGDSGLFLIRESESKLGDFFFLLRDGEIVKYYRIRFMDSGGYYIVYRVKFLIFSEFVEYY